MGNTNIIPVSAQFIGDNLSQCGAHMLPHLGANNIDQYRSLRVNFKPNNGRKSGAGAGIGQIRGHLIRAASWQQGTKPHDQRRTSSTGHEAASTERKC
jgi:hypothetical protein